MLHHIIFNPLFQGFPGKRLALTMDFTTDIMVQDQRRKKWGGTVLQYREYDTEILNRIKDVEKQILCKYIEICEKYHLRYFVAFGTLLGTVRHKGFIPWDDDIDVGMPREDYERFLQIAQKECGEEYFLQTVDTDPEYHLYFAKLRMNRTRFVENSLQKAGSVTGFYIDIFPYDEISDDEEEMEKQLNRAVRWGMILSIYKVKEPQIGQYGHGKGFCDAIHLAYSAWGNASLRDFCQDGLEKVQSGIYEETGERKFPDDNVCSRRKKMDY